MAHRSKDWDESLAEDLKDPEFAAEFVMAALEEGIPLQTVLAKVIRTYGLKEFADKTRIPSSNLLRAIDPHHNPTQETLQKLLSPLGLELSVAPKKKVA